MSDADLLADAGRLLFGERWLVPLGEALGVSSLPAMMAQPDSARWRPVPPGVLREVAGLLRARAAAAFAAAEALDDRADRVEGAQAKI